MFAVLCLGLLIDDELRITAISQDLDQADEWLVSAFMRTKRTLRLSVVIESLLLIALVAITLRGLTTRVRQPLNHLRADLHRAREDHDHVIRPVGPLEIVDVALDTEHLRRTLVSQIDIATQYAQALTLEAPAMNALRNALDREHDPVPGIVSYCRPVEGVIAGDWWWTAQRKDGSRVLAIADVSGHGVHAGVMAIESRAIVATALASYVPLGEIAYGLARHRWASGMFLTLFMAVLTADELEYCSAGAPFAGLISSRGSQILRPTGPVISNLQGQWSSRRLSFEHDSILLSATDGLVEVLSEEQIVSEVQRVLPLRGRDPEEILKAVVSTTRQRETHWSDDLTVILATAIS
jgi:hypothetical protein